ncbi:WbqC family protein [Patiriisocius hiemis]|uniref:WbqC family protein n=1 Tax=Patiriisocius hiemis TaxID=3075604 RepID=A0ABU2YG50_9FLAO|nr:WbqC family protein [Constantimarinum sp. W242]MDT0556018.1 WbqC family protein [Constantimarinum sp. W242]
MKSSIAIMQPYLFPYIGYFQLIHAVDTFVFYDDVHYIKRGWINRNKLLVQGKESLFTVPLKEASQNKLIKETYIQKSGKWEEKFFQTLAFNYKKAPYFLVVEALLKEIFKLEYETIADLAIHGIEKISHYLSLNTKFELSSEAYHETVGMEKADRLIAITKQKGVIDYINPSGGKELYEKSYFSDQGVRLHFIENNLVPYPQFRHPSVVGLSIIDVLMFNSKQETLHLIEQYKLN